jgi:hypothetical protein
MQSPTTDTNTNSDKCTFEETLQLVVQMLTVADSAHTLDGSEQMKEADSQQDEQPTLEQAPIFA